MTRQEQINNWLTSAFTSGSTKMSEFFYYDRRDNQFFSILQMDHFIVDEKFEVAKDVSVSYSADTIKLLTDRMKRIDSEHSDILSIPLADENGSVQEQIDTFLNLNSIDIDTATIWDTEDPSITFQVD